MIIRYIIHILEGITAILNYTCNKLSRSYRKAKGKSNEKANFPKENIFFLIIFHRPSASIVIYQHFCTKCKDNIHYDLIRLC